MRRLFHRWPRLAIGSDVLFHKEGRQLLGQGTSHVFAFRERHQLALVRFSEHPLESYSRS